MGYFNGNLAKEILRRTSWSDKVWSRKYQAVLVSNEDSQASCRAASGSQRRLAIQPTTQEPGAVLGMGKRLADCYYPAN